TFIPQATNIYQVRILFNVLNTVPSGRAGLPGGGALALDIYDADGNLIVSGSPDSDGNNSPAVFGATNDPAFPQFNKSSHPLPGATPDAINTYDFANLSGVGSGIPGVSLVDKEGPQVIGVSIPAGPGYNLFAPKPTSGPTPLTQTLQINFVD